MNRVRALILLILAATPLNSIAALSNPVVGKIEFVQEIPLMDLSAEAKILYGGLEHKEKRSPLHARVGARKGSLSSSLHRARAQNHKLAASSSSLSASATQQSANTQLQEERAKTQPSAKKDNYYGFACFAGHMVDNAIFCIEPNGHVMKRMKTDYIPCGVYVDQARRVAYVSDASNGNVIVYDLLTKSPIKSINIGGCPCGLTLDHKRSLLYVADQKGNKLAIVDTAGMTCVGHVPVGNLPRSVALTPDGKFAYVTNEYGNSVSVVDTAKKICVKNILTGKMPLGIAMNPNGKEVYVANSDSDFISIIDTATNTESARVKIDTQPGKLLVEPTTHTVYASTVRDQEKDGRGIVIAFDSDTKELVAEIPTGFGADDMRLDLTKQRLYVQGFDDDSVYVIDLKVGRTTQYFINHPEHSLRKSKSKGTKTTSKNGQ